jgi:serine protease Do
MLTLYRFGISRWGWTLRALVAALFFAGGLVTGLKAATLKLPSVGAIAPLAANNPALALQNAFIDVAAKVSPAVVNISSEWTENVQGFGMDDFFNQFWGNPYGGRRPHPQYKQKQRSLGSGVIITADGYIITNAHVVDKAEKVTVTFENGTTYPGKIVGKDQRADIAVVKISDGAKTFPYAVLGNSDDIKVGQWSIAIGNPFALDHTVTTGVISAKGRSVASPESSQSLQNYIQTDASINPGNSGGPLCNIQGEVIGINNMIYSQSGGSVGIGFAIPANIARKTAEDLVNEGKVVRAGLGAVVQNLTAKMAKSFGLQDTQGALLAGINSGSAAEKAGLKAGDIVLSVDGDTVQSSNDLVSKLYTHKPGDKVQLSVLRNGQESTFAVTLQKLDETAVKLKKDQGEEEGGPEDQNNAGANQSLGFAYQDQTPDIRSQLPNGAPKGPVVTQVGQGTAAAQAGFQQGDIILKVGNTAIVSANQLGVVLGKSDLKNGVRIYLWRDGTNLFSFLQTGDE